MLILGLTEDWTKVFKKYGGLLSASDSMLEAYHLELDGDGERDERITAQNTPSHSQARPLPP